MAVKGLNYPQYRYKSYILCISIYYAFIHPCPNTITFYIPRPVPEKAPSGGENVEPPPRPPLIPPPPHSPSLIYVFFLSHHHWHHYSPLLPPPTPPKKRRRRRRKEQPFLKKIFLKHVYSNLVDDVSSITGIKTLRSLQRRQHNCLISHFGDVSTLAQVITCMVP